MGTSAGKRSLVGKKGSVQRDGAVVLRKPQRRQLAACFLLQWNRCTSALAMVGRSLRPLNGFTALGRNTPSQGAYFVRASEIIRSGGTLQAALPFKRPRLHIPLWLNVGS